MGQAPMPCRIDMLAQAFGIDQSGLKQSNRRRVSIRFMGEIRDHLIEEPGESLFGDAIDAGARLGAIGDTRPHQQYPCGRRVSQGGEE